ncbi:MAG: HAD hydrolase-like protein [Clostridia bacterium]|nr:HAD hydrolase-like protein [Clostridia bacterium]
MKFNAAVFDVDGTLIDNSEGIYNCIRYALQKMDLPDMTDEQLRPFIGPPLFESGKKILMLDDKNAERFVSLYRERFSVKGYAETKVYDGVAEMLQTLQDNGLKMAIATGKPLQFIEKILPLFDLDKYFCGIHGITFKDHESDKVTFIKRSLADCNTTEAQTLMIGDRHNDMEAAKCADVFAAGVKWGFGTDEELLNAGADKLFASPAELTDYILN